MAESRKWTNISVGQMLKQWTGPIGIGSGPGNRHCDQNWDIARKSWLKPSPIQVGGVGWREKRACPEPGLHLEARAWSGDPPNNEKKLKKKKKNLESNN